MKSINDIVNESVKGKGSNKLSDVIARLQELEKEYGGDIEVFSDTQDGAFYSVITDDISIKDCTKPGNKKVKCVYIE